MRSSVLSLGRTIPRSYSTMAQASKVPAQEFLDYVNASPTRMLLLYSDCGSKKLTGSSFPCRPIVQGPSGQGWIPGNQGTYSHKPNGYIEVLLE